MHEEKISLLFVTQIWDPDDPVLGFVPAWVEAFASRARQVTVLCLEQRAPALDGVRVISLGKEQGSASRLSRLLRFWSLLWRARSSYTHVLCHMNPVYVVAGSFIWHLLRKRIALWYAHGAVTPMLRIAGLLSHRIVTSTSQGYRLPYGNVSVIGQGIDTAHFTREHCPQTFAAISVGRISPSKHCDVLIRAVGILAGRGMHVTLQLVGSPGLASQQSYNGSLRELVHQLNLGDYISFVGPRTYAELPQVLHQAAIFVSASTTGSLDKAALEAMSCGIPVVACNPAITEVLRDFPHTAYDAGDAAALASCMAHWFELPDAERDAASAALREVVVRDHSLPGFVDRLFSSIR